MRSTRTPAPHGPAATGLLLAAVAAIPFASVTIAGRLGSFVAGSSAGAVTSLGAFALGEHRAHLLAELLGARGARERERADRSEDAGDEGVGVSHVLVPMVRPTMARRRTNGWDRRSAPRRATQNAPSVPPRSGRRGSEPDRIADRAPGVARRTGDLYVPAGALPNGFRIAPLRLRCVGSRV